MGRPGMVRAAALIMFFAAAGCLAAQEEAARTQLFFGPRLGISAVVQWPGVFSSDMRSILHDSREYFPVFTEIGFQAQQLFPLGGPWGSFTFQQTFLLGGLEQRMPLPSLSLTFGYRMRFGLELGLGPYATIAAVDGNPGFALSIVYTLGWIFITPDFDMPLTLMFVPIPGYMNPHISLLFGLNFWALR